MAVLEQQESDTINSSNGKLIELDEEIEGDQIGSKNYRFCRIGEPVSIRPDVELEFDPDSPPSRPLAVAESFGVLFVAHSDGFCLVRTKDAMNVAEEIKEKGSGLSLQELSVVDVPIGKVSILALSSDESRLAASVGGSLHFFSVISLLSKEPKPSFSCLIDDAGDIKDMIWTRRLENCFVVLLRNGKLLHGVDQCPPNDVMDNVDAVDWSVKGNFIAVARENVLTILSLKFKEKLSMPLSFKSLIGDFDVNCCIKVDSLRWIRPDCIVIGCFQLNKDGEVDNYVVQVITSKDSKMTSTSSQPIALSFSDIFLGFSNDAVPNGIGPHMFLTYLYQCELAFIANRKNTDNHIMLFGWSLNGKENEAALIEILNDAWNPSINSQDNGDDNLILALSVDKISHSEEVKLLLGEEETEVKPCCVLLCLTVDGKLSMFHFASAAGTPLLPGQVSDEEEDFPSEVDGVLPELSSGTGELSEQIVLGVQSSEVTSKLKLKGGDEAPAVPKSLTPTLLATSEFQEKNIAETQEVASLNLMSSGGDERLTKINQIGDDQQSLVLGKQVSTSEQPPQESDSDDHPVKDNKEPPIVQNSFILSASNNLHLRSTIETPGVQTLNLKASKGDEHGKAPAPKMDKNGDVHDSPFRGKSFANIEQLSKKKSEIDDLTPDLKDFMKTETKQFAKVGSSTDSFSGRSSTNMSSLSITKDSQKGPTVSVEFPGNMGSSSIPSVSSLSGSSVRHSPSKASGGISILPTSGVGQGNQSNHSSTNVSTAPVHIAGHPLQDPSFLKDISGPQNLVNLSRQRTSTGTGNAQSFFATRSSQLTGQENVPIGSSLNLTSQSNKENYKRPSATVLVNSEPNLSKQFRNVEDMAKELDTLLECIERPGGFKEASISAQKRSVLGLEEGLRNLADSCKAWRGMGDQLQDIHVLLDKTIQVLSKKLYMEGIVKQATDTQYWDLWNCQKLSSELELKRQRILELNQDLANKLIELERHFNGLELNKFDENGGVQSNRKALQNKHGPSRQIQYLRSLHNTMSAQLMAAEQLSECLTKQMAVLNMESPIKRKQNVKKELFETIGIPFDAPLFNSPDEAKINDTPASENLRISSCSATAKVSRRNQSSVVKSLEPETIRRRRESLDQSWASFEPSKTTVKRLLLQDNREKIGGSRSPLSMDKHSVSPSLDGSTVGHSKHSLTIFSSKSKSCQDTTTKPAPAVPNFQCTYDFKDLSRAVGSTSSTMQALPVGNLPTFSSQSASQPSPTFSLKNAMETSDITADGSRGNINSVEKPNLFAMTNQAHSISASLPAEKPKSSCEISKSDDKQTGFMKSTIGNVKHRAATTQPEKNQALPFSPIVAVSSAASLSERAFHLGTATSKSQSEQIISSSALPVSIFSSSTEFINSKSEKHSETQASKFSLKARENSTIQTSAPLPANPAGTPSSKPEHLSPSAPTTEALTSLQFRSHVDMNASAHSSVQQPELPTPITDLKTGASVSAPTSEPSASFQSGIHLNSGIANPASNEVLNSKPEQPLALNSLSSGALSGSKYEISSATVTQEDEMEEEAPEANQTTEVTLGSFGGFGIGSAPNRIAAKPNPFGATFSNTVTNPTSSSFTMTVPSGQLFRPASLSFPPAQPFQLPQPTNFGPLSSGFSIANPNQVSTGGGFGQAAQIGPGQHALGSVLGSFGQSRQFGAGMPGTGVSPINSSGFSSNHSAGGFSNAAAGSGFANLASAGGGFAAAGTTGRFAAAAAATGAGFVSAASGGVAGGGFGAFGNQQGSAFSAFGGGTGTARPPSELFTQMRR